MSFLERAKQAAEQAKQAAEHAADRTAAKMNDPSTIEKTRSKLRGAKRGLVTALERIDPAVLADVVIKATILQERANASLQQKGSPYRIAEIGIGAAIPPSVTFTIARVGEPVGERELWREEEAAATAGGTITALDGTQLEDDDLEVLAESPEP